MPSDEYDVVWCGSIEPEWTFGKGSLLHPRGEFIDRNFELYREDKKSIGGLKLRKKKAHDTDHG